MDFLMRIPLLNSKYTASRGSLLSEHQFHILDFTTVSMIKYSRVFHPRSEVVPPRYFRYISRGQNDLSHVKIGTIHLGMCCDYVKRRYVSSCYYFLRPKCESGRKILPLCLKSRC
ncbi:hypothetical protein CEXT_739641 [Caerostris extrusa]|uniref:Uncharacterized protein n=1 Tax=Caerostris extrusa TaxID=172846 RepID=A0AAV4VWZ2_CAEEX|nr:hypothetical protein CEXT_739641 [Caerostris extrusa]